MNEFLNDEANRCLQCKNARCQKGCPINTPIPEIIKLFKEDKIKEAGEILFNNNPLSAICSIVCPVENQCQKDCVRGIKGNSVEFNKIEEYISNKFLEEVSLNQQAKLDTRIAIIGSGPAGITIALILARKGYKVTIFESHSKIGGVLRYGIPEFRLSKGVLDRLEKELISLNVKIRPNTLIGPVLTLDKLREDGYKAIFVGTGVWNPKALGVKGESLGHVNYAINYLKEPSVYRLGDKVCIIGAGNVAMDAARTAKRNGAKEVTVLYRKGFEDMPATRLEINEAKEDGVRFELFKAPLEILDEGVKYIETERIVTESGRVSTRNLEGTENIFECDSVIIAVSQSPKDNIVSSTKGLNIDRYGLIVVDELGHTTKKGVFASGDVVTGAKTVVAAVAHAKVVAETMDKFCEDLI